MKPLGDVGKERLVKHPTLYRTLQVDGSIFCREAGPKDAPALLLLHGLPSSSRMFELSEPEAYRRDAPTAQVVRGFDSSRRGTAKGGFHAL